MIKELPQIVLKGKQLKKFHHLKRKYPVSQKFLHQNWPNAKRFIIYALTPRCVLRSYAWRKRRNRIILIRRIRIVLFDPRLKRMIKRRKANVKQWSSSIVRFYKKMGQIMEYEETELYGEELSKQMKQQLELLKSNKRSLSLIEDANKNVELQLVKTESHAEPQEPLVEEKVKLEEIKSQVDEKLTIKEDIKKEPMETAEANIKPIPEANVEMESAMLPAAAAEPAIKIEPAVILPSSNADEAPQRPIKSSGSKFLDMLMNKVRVKNFAKETNFTPAANDLKISLSKPMETTSELCINEDTSEDFVGFDESAHQPGMLLTPLVPQSCKTVDGNGAFVSDALEAYMKKNNLRDSQSEDEPLLEPMYQDGRVTAHSVPPHMDMPAVPDSLHRLRTVADRRHYLQRSKNQKMAIVNNEANIYRELQRKQRQRKVKIGAMQQLQSSGSQMPFTRQGWQAASYVATEADKYYYQVIRVDGEMVRLPGSQGNNVRREKQPHRSRLLPQEIATLQCSNQCVDANLRNELKILPTHHSWSKGKVQKLNQYPLPAIFRPCPLSQKPYQKPLDDDTAALLLSGGSMAIVSMPTVQLDVKPQLGRPLDEIAKRYLQHILPHHDITREWAEFSVSTLRESPNSMREAEAQAAAQSSQSGRRKSFTFVIPYLNDRNHILVRRVVDRSEQLDQSFSAAQPPENLRQLEFLKQLPEKPDSIALDCADMVIDMINTVAISCSENSFIKVDPDTSSNPTPDISPIKEEISTTSKSPVPVDCDGLAKPGSKVPSHKSRLNKQQRLAKELRRLNATIIDAAAIAKDANKPCMKDHCQLGCLCESIASELPAREHCGRAECVLECRCTGAELTRIMRVETDGRGISNEDAFNLRRQATARLAKMEKDFTSTLVLTDNETLLINETQCDKKRRCTKVPKRYEDFEDSVEDDEQILLRANKVAKREQCLKRTRTSTESVNMSFTEPCSVKDTDFAQLKHCQVSLRRLPDVANLATFCMTHQLYKCFCGGLAIDGKPIVIEKEKAELPVPYYVPELATRAHYSFERPPEESNKKRRKEKPQPQKQLQQKQPQFQNQSLLKQAQLQKAHPQKQPQVQHAPAPQPQKPQNQKQLQLSKAQPPQQPQLQKQTVPQQLQRQAEPQGQLQLESQPQRESQPQGQKPKMVNQKQQTTLQKKANSDGLKRQLVKLLPKPSSNPVSPSPPPVVPIETEEITIPPVTERTTEKDIIFSYYRSQPNLCRRAVAIPKDCYLRLNRRQARIIRQKMTFAETQVTKKILERRISGAVSFYRSELDQQRRLEQQAARPGYTVIEVADDSDECEKDPATCHAPTRKRISPELINDAEQQPKRKKQLEQLPEEAEEPATEQPKELEQPVQAADKLDIQIPKISACYSLNANSMDAVMVGNEPVEIAINEEIPPTVDLIAIRSSCNDVIKKMNMHVSKKMQDIDLALQRESKIIPAPNEEILCIIKWSNFLAAFESNYVYIWDVQMKNHSFLAATITNMMPAVCGAIAVVNTHFSPNRSALPLMARMLLEGKRNENTSRLAVVMQGRQQYWLVKGFLRYMEGNACTKPTPQTHPILTKKINVLCMLMMKQRVREQQRNQRTSVALNPLETTSLLNLNAAATLGTAGPVAGTSRSLGIPGLVPTGTSTSPAAATLAAATARLTFPPGMPASISTAPTATVTSASPGLTTATAPSRSLLAATGAPAAKTSTSAGPSLMEAESKEPSMICSNIEFRRVTQGDAAELQLPEMHAYDHRWLVLNLFDDFSHIFVPAFMDMISLDRIYNLMRVAHDTKKMVKVQFFENAPYDAIVTPLSKRKIYFGPLRLDMKPPVLVLLQSVDGKMMLREVYQRVHNIPVQQDRRSMAFWLLQINGRVHFDIDLANSMGALSVQLSSSEQVPAPKALAEAEKTVAASEDDDDCVIVINDDEDDTGQGQEDNGSTKQPQEQQQQPAKVQRKPSVETEQPPAPNRINFTIQTVPNQVGGSLQITAATSITGNAVQEVTIPALPAGFVPFIANVPVSPDGTAPATQFLTPQVQLTQTAAPLALASIEPSTSQPPPAKISRISVQRCPATATTSSAVVAAAKDPPAPKINNSLQQLLSSGPVQLGYPSTGLTITKMKKANGSLSTPVVEPIKIGAKRKSEEPPAASTGQKPTASVAVQGNLSKRQVRLPKLAPKGPVPAVRKSLPAKPTAATEPPRLSLPAKGPAATATQPVKTPVATVVQPAQVSEAAAVPAKPSAVAEVTASTGATAVAGATASTGATAAATAAPKISKLGFLVAKDLPRFRAKFTNGVYVVKVPDGGLCTFKSCAAASGFLNRHLSREGRIKEHLPGEWKFVLLENAVPKCKDDQIKPVAAPIVIED